MASAAARVAAPGFQLPFPCGETWVGSSGSYAHTGNEIDFNGRANDGDGDLGRTVVAAAAGTVVTSAYQTNNGYGNLIKIRHSDGSATLYAHLNSRSVSAGATVAQGQKIGTVGKSSAKYKVAAHLHYEQRSPSGAIVPASFNGVTFKYPGQNVTSNNCGGGAPSTPSKPAPTPSKPAPTPSKPAPSPSKPAPSSPNPYTAGQVCGAGFKEIDSASLAPRGRVVLMYSATTGKNCVVTLRATGTGKESVSAYLEVKGKSRQSDSGSYQYYAGPLRAAAARTCVKWGGSIGTARYDSPFEHCR
ncbi:M23 family metallopeptidase [Microtetraspora sp. NBRC 16547]|uniref:M23 family metallopeptidase n=1 Tax=Microtetraspora sp. NBRC 16547 TaxID=3030993 RepID=UPI0024A43620|nr:M23 family metallopeptidase [Microtetraspora sp. NBRC 16547]GLW99511.1 peptidase M23 [Microtetraspora sp. NBRC 16547]